MTTDLKAIRFVTKRYEQLQGLRLVAIGASFASCFGIYALAGAPGGDWGMIAAIVSALVMAAAGMTVTGRHYSAHFGRAVRPPATTAGLWLPMTISLVTTIAARLLDTGAVTIALAINAGWALLVTVRDWPFRLHYLLGVFICGAVTAKILSLPSPHLNLYDAIGLAIVGVAYISVGFMDHRLLRSVMRRGGSESSTELETTEAGLKSWATREPE